MKSPHHRAKRSRLARSPRASHTANALRGRLLSEMNQKELLEFKAQYPAMTAAIDEVIAAEKESKPKERAQCEPFIGPLSRSQLGRVDEAVEIIGPTTDQREECQRLIGFAVKDVEYFKRRADDPKRFGHLPIFSLVGAVTIQRAVVSLIPPRTPAYRVIPSLLSDRAFRIPQ